MSSEARRKGPGRPRGPNYEKNKRKTDRKLARQANAPGIHYRVRICDREYSGIGEHWVIKRMKLRRDRLRQLEKTYIDELAAIRTESARLDTEAEKITRLIGPNMKLCPDCYSVNDSPGFTPHPHFNTRTGEYTCFEISVARIDNVFANPEAPDETDSIL